MMAARPDEARLRDLLAQVHERLSRAASVDVETRRLLVTLTRDIERALGGPQSGAGTPPQGQAEIGTPGTRASHAGGRGHSLTTPQESLSSLEGLAARFDADHPALAQTLRELADLLGKVGI